MPEDTQVVNPPADTADSQPKTVIVPVPNPLEARLAQLEADSRKKDELLTQYAIALGTRTQPAQPVAPVKAEAEFDDATKQFVDSRAQQQATRIVERAKAEIVAQSRISERLAEDPEIRPQAEQVYAALKQHPAYSGLDDYIVQELAVSQAREAFLVNQRTQQRADALKKQQEADRIQSANSTSLPATGRGQSYRTPTVDNPDADLQEWMEQPESKLMFSKFIERPNINPASTEKIRWYGEDVPIADLYKRFAVRAVRTGVGLSERMHGAFPEVQR